MSPTGSVELGERDVLLERAWEAGREGGWVLKGAWDAGQILTIAWDNGEKEGGC